MGDPEGKHCSFLFCLQLTKIDELILWLIGPQLSVVMSGALYASCEAISNSKSFKELYMWISDQYVRKAYQKFICESDILPRRVVRMLNEL